MKSVPRRWGRGFDVPAVENHTGGASPACSWLEKVQERLRPRGSLPLLCDAPSLMVGGEVKSLLMSSEGNTGIGTGVEFLFLWRMGKTWGCHDSETE